MTNRGWMPRTRLHFTLKQRHPSNVPEPRSGRGMAEAPTEQTVYYPICSGWLFGARTHHNAGTASDQTKASRHSDSSRWRCRWVARSGSIHPPATGLPGGR